MQPLGLTQAVGVQRKHVNELCKNRRNVTAATALILARVFGNSPDFWLNVQRRSDLWEAMHSKRERIERATTLGQPHGICRRHPIAANQNWIQKSTAYQFRHASLSPPRAPSRYAPILHLARFRPVEKLFDPLAQPPKIKRLFNSP